MDGFKQGWTAFEDPIPDGMLWICVCRLRQAPLTEVTRTVNIFPQVTLLMEHAVVVVLHEFMIPPLSAVTETRKWSASPLAFQETAMSLDEQLTSAFTF